MFGKVVNSIREGTFFEKIFQRVVSALSRIYIFYARRHFQIKENKIVFITFEGKYTCNPKAICDEILHQKLDYKLVWVIRRENLKDTSLYPQDLKLVVRGTKKFYKEISSAKYIVQNANDTAYLNYKKKVGQIIIQTWHGSLGFKRINRENVNNNNWIKKTQNLANETDYILSNSTFENDIFRSSYWTNSIILDYGHPRNDILLDKKKNSLVSNRVKKEYNIPKDAKIILYAPTYRDNLKKDLYDIDYDMLIDSVKQRFGGEWYLFVRFHHKLRNLMLLNTNYDKHIVNVSDYYNMQELLCTADIGITDYSSWICDFVLTGKPGFLYMNDIDDYSLERGFYYPLSEAPFSISNDNYELRQNILSFNQKEYIKSRDNFLSLRGCKENGNASKKLVAYFWNKK